MHRLKDPRLGFVSITKVDLSRDCRYLKASISVMGTQADKTKIMKALEGASKFVGREVGKHLQTHTTPEISFELDESIEKGIEICKLLDRISTEDNPQQDNEEETPDQE